jgi:biotin carboxyl carrier protein
VKKGEAVAVGTYSILEVMKMQNEIVWSVEGKVTLIRAEEGTAIKKHSILIVLE